MQETGHLQVTESLFARVYVVGLDDYFRGDNTILELQEPGVEVVRFAATDGNRIQNLEEVYDAKTVQKLLGRQMSRAEIGCAISHQRIIQDAINFEGEFIVVLEDDTDLDVPVSALKSLPTVKTSTPTLTELVTNARFSLPKERIKIKGDLHARCPKVYRSLSVPTSSRCYVLNRAAIQALQPNQNRIYYLADFPPDYLNKVQFWYTKKPLASDKDVPSTIGNRPVFSSGIAEVWRETKLIMTWGYGSRKPFSLKTLISFIFFRRLAALIFRFRRTR